MKVKLTLRSFPFTANITELSLSLSPRQKITPPKGSTIYICKFTILVHVLFLSCEVMIAVVSIHQPYICEVVKGYVDLFYEVSVLIGQLFRNTNLIGRRQLFRGIPANCSIPGTGGKSNGNVAFDFKNFYIESYLPHQLEFLS